MKKFFLSPFALILVLLLSVAGTRAMAQQRSTLEAEILAGRFMSTLSAGSQSKGSTMNSLSTMQMTARSSDIIELSPDGDEAFYVFTPSGQSGYVIVSASKAMAPVLAYSATGTFDVNNLPPAMIYLLQSYQRELDYLQSLPGYEYRQYRENTSASRAAADVEPLIATKWNQDDPYNAFCPVDGGFRSFTGCAATAAAQLMKYYAYPSHGTGSISYTTTTKHFNVSYDFNATTFDWANMTNTYDATSTSVQKDAVATLMAACGAAFSMDYTSTTAGSSSVINEQMAGLARYLGYDQDMAMVNRDNMSLAEWHAYLQNELNASHPIIFSGQSPKGGHSFIIDGYTNDDASNPSYHINWGWGGYQDDYFKISALDPNDHGIGGGSGGYNSGQNFFKGCIPDNGVVDLNSYWEGEKITVSPATVKPGVSTKVHVSIDNIVNMAVRDFTGNLRLYLVDGDKEILLHTISVNQPLSWGRGYILSFDVTIPATVSAGTHDIILKSCSNVSDGAQPVHFRYGNAKLSVSETGEGPEVTKYSVKVIASEGGTVTASAQEVELGGKVVFTIVPDEDYVVQRALLNGRDVTGNISNNTLTVIDINQDVTFEVTFAQPGMNDADIQITKFEVVKQEGRTVSAVVSQIANLGPSVSNVKISLALADANDNVVTAFGGTLNVGEFQTYGFINQSVSFENMVIPATVVDGKYRLCAAVFKVGCKGWNVIRKFELADGIITAKDMPCYTDITLSNGVIVPADDPTGISTVTLTPDHHAVYNLSGQKVNTLQPGRVYIVNGRKTVVK